MTVAKVTSPSKGSLRWIKGAKRPTPHKIPPQTKRAGIAIVLLYISMGITSRGSNCVSRQQSKG